MGIQLICPHCHADLKVLKDTFHCTTCPKEYTSIGGIPDLRVFPDPILGLEEDYRRTDSIIKTLYQNDFKSLLEYYWSMSDITPEYLIGRFIRSVMIGEQRAQRVLNNIMETNHIKFGTESKLLEIGSGSGNFLSIAIKNNIPAVGIDIAMRWLHLSRRRFMDSGLIVPKMVCCCAEYLPFPPEKFDLIVINSTIEFIGNQRKVIAECSRCLKENGILCINTVNRYSIAPNPYVYLWLVGFLPRSLQAKYVKWRRNSIFNIRLLSYHEIKALTNDYFEIIDSILPDIDDKLLNQFSDFTQFQIHIYRKLKNLPIFRDFFKWFGPGWDIIFCKKIPGEGSAI